jgi:hypothetical protein
MSARQHRIGIANEVRRQTGEVETFALAWTDEREVIARIQRGRQFEYRAFPMTEDVVVKIAAWVLDNVGDTV